MDKQILSILYNSDILMAEQIGWPAAQCFWTILQLLDLSLIEGWLGEVLALAIGNLWENISHGLCSVGIWSAPEKFSCIYCFFAFVQLLRRFWSISEPKFLEERGQINKYQQPGYRCSRLNQLEHKFDKLTPQILYSGPAARIIAWILEI